MPHGCAASARFPLPFHPCLPSRPLLSSLPPPPCTHTLKLLQLDMPGGAARVLLVLKARLCSRGSRAAAMGRKSAAQLVSLFTSSAVKQVRPPSRSRACRQGGRKGERGGSSRHY